MIQALQNILYQFGVAIYQITSFRVGSYDVGERAQLIGQGFLDSSFIRILEIILVPITIALFVGLIVFASKTRALHQKIITAQSNQPADLKPEALLSSRWQEIANHIDSNHEGEWKFAIIEADSLVDSVLKNLFPGDTMGERLMNIDKTNLLSIDDLWEAHKIRNRLAHDSNYFLRHAEAARAVRLYEKTLKELGAL